MGTILTEFGDAAYDHEGYAGQVLDDGSITGTYSNETRPRMVGQVVAACGCGWAGTTRYPTTTTSGRFDEDGRGAGLGGVGALARPARLSSGCNWRTCRGCGGSLRSWAGRRPVWRLSRWRVCRLAGRLEVIERVLGALHGALELTRDLRDSVRGDLE